MDYMDKDEMFEFEKYICSEKPITWISTAMGLFYSAEVLYEFESKKSADIFEKTGELQTLFSNEIVKYNHFNFRVQRMLWAYGFENIFKVLIIDLEKQHHENSTELYKIIKSHSFNYLVPKANVTLTDDETFYLNILEKCAVWAGRYPLPIKANQMYQQRAGMSSHEELNERAKKTREDFVAGKIPRIETESDIFHSGIGDKEIKIYKDLKTRLIQLLREKTLLE